MHETEMHHSSTVNSKRKHDENKIKDFLLFAAYGRKISLLAVEKGQLLRSKPPI